MKKAALRELKKHISVLKLIHEKYKTAIIAGGVIRDLYHEKPVKDVDIFVPFVLSQQINSSHWSEVFKLDNSALSKDYVTHVESDTSGGLQMDIETTFIVTKDTIDYNVILINADPIEYVNNCFDIGLCKTYTDGTQIIYTSDFTRDSNNKTLTILSLDISYKEYTYMYNNHLARLSKKYPDYTIIDLYAKYKNKNKLIRN